MKLFPPPVQPDRQPSDKSVWLLLAATAIILATLLLTGCDHGRPTPPAPVSETVPLPPTSPAPVDGPVLTSPAQVPDDQIMEEIRRAPATDGRNRAVIFGLNYPGTSMELKGCVKDARHITCDLVRLGYFKPGEIRVLLNEQATTAAIKDALRWVAADAKAGDKRFVYFSGHGTQDAKGAVGERDGLNEVWVTHDFAWDGIHCIPDDFIYETFKTIPEGVRLAMLSDSCHSGTMIRPTPRYEKLPKTITPPPEVQARIRESVKTARKRAQGVLNIQYGAGCAEDQLSSDTPDGGAFTIYFLVALKARTDLTFKQLIQSAGSRMKAHGYGDQNPQAEGLGIDRPFLQ